MGRLPTFDPGFTTDELTRIYSADRTVVAMLEFEAALALALADAGIAPSAEAEEVVSACRSGVGDPEAIVSSTWDVGTPLIALREAIVSKIENDDASRWFHFGATSQDTIDTAQMIQAAEALDSVNTRLTSIAARLRELTMEYRDLAHMGRTLLQDARPTTFGFRTATWLDAVVRHVEDLRAQRTSLMVQLGGPVGTMEEYGDQAPAVMAALATRLGLEAPDVCWHGDRGRIWSLVETMSRTAGTMAKIGLDIALLVSTGISEIRVRSGGSSSMPGKENPVDSFRAVAAGTACSGAMTMLTSAPPVQLDRGIGGWHVEWVAVPLAFRTAAAAVEAIDICLRSLSYRGEATTADPAVIAGVTGQIDTIIEKADRLLT
jgi:3-carboxy-cis,cis-muconate cycloisomerase